MNIIVSAFSLTGRACQIFWTIGRFAILPSLRPLKSRSPLPERLRLAAEQLGGAWVKLGQGLALRFDLLPAEYCSEFMKLLNDTRPFSYDLVREIIKEELGHFPERVFASFESEPFATASIAQVHRATSLDGMPLAVKIRKPAVERQFAADFRIMRLLSYGLDVAGTSEGKSARLFISEFERWTCEEIDFTNEARNGHRMALFSRGDPIHVDAKVRFEWTTRRVLTTEYLDGVSLLNIIRAIRQSDNSYIDDLRHRGFDLSRIAHNISWNMLNQIFRDGFFHADTHPANLVVLPGNAIGYFDFGIAGSVSEELLESLQKYIRHLFRNDFDRAVAEVLRWTTASATTNLNQARQDMVMVFENYRYGSAGRAEFRRPLQLTSSFIMEMMSIARQHRLSITQDLILYFKAVLTADALIFELAPQYDVFAEANKFFSRSLDLDLGDLLETNLASGTILNLGHQASRLVNNFSRIQGAGRTLQVWLDTLEARLIFYEFWAMLFGVGAYLIYQDDGPRLLQNDFGAGRYWLVGGMILGMMVFLAMIWRQGRRLSLGDRRDGATRRSLGRGS